MAGNPFDGEQGRYGAELKVVTLLFVDLVNSLGSILHLTPEDASEFLESVTNRVTEIANDHSGTVASLAGDGVLFLFGVPIANSRHALNACAAALQMRVAIRALFDEASNVSLRIGLSSGEALIRPTKTGIGWQYSATGLAVHLGARMEQMAAPGMICATDAVFELAKEHFDFTELEPQHVKGLDDDVTAYSLEGERGAEAQTKAIYKTRFVGREAELSRLREIIETPSSGRSVVILLTGDAGVGKSRLMFEAQDLFRRENAYRVVYYKGHYSFFEPFAVAQQCIDQLVPGARSIGLDAFLGSMGVRPEDGTETAEVIGELHKAIHARNKNDDMTGSEHRNLLGVYRAGFAALLKVSRPAQKSIFLFDEFLEFDEESREVLQAVMSSGGSGSEVFVISMRSDRLTQSFLSGFDEMQLLRLRALNDQSSLAIVSELITANGSLAIDANDIVRKSGGNPLFIEELVKSSHSRRNAARPGRSNGNGLRAPPVKTDSAVLTALISERIDRLPHQAKETLRIASILGEEFNSDLLSDVLIRSRLAGDVETLMAETFLVSNNDGSEDRLGFVHPLVHEVVIGSILRRDRLRMHRAAFEALASRSGKDDRAEALEIAHHANEAQLWMDAVTWFWCAASLANERAMNSLAISLFGNAICAANNLDDARERVRHQIDLLVEMRNPLYQIGDLDGVVERLTKARTMAKDLADSRRLGKILLCESHVAWLRGRQTVAFDSASQALELANATDDQALRVRSNFHTALAHFATGDCLAAAELLVGVVVAIESGIASGFLGVNLGLAATAESYRARSLLEIGDTDAARQSALAATTTAARAKDLFAKIIADISSGIVHLGCGLVEASVQYFASAMQAVNVVEAKLMIPVCEANYGLMKLATGDRASGRHYIENSIQESLQIGLKFQLATRYLFLCMAQMLAGELDAARKSARNALDAAKVCGEERTAECAGKFVEFLGAANDGENEQIIEFFRWIKLNCPQFSGAAASIIGQLDSKQNHIAS